MAEILFICEADITDFYQQEVCEEEGLLCVEYIDYAKNDT